MGAYTHKNSNGLIVETGIWKVTELMNFDSDGIAPGALLRDKRRSKSLGLFPMSFSVARCPQAVWLSSAFNCYPTRQTKRGHPTGELRDWQGASQPRRRWHQVGGARSRTQIRPKSKWSRDVHADETLAAVREGMAE